MRLVTRVVCVLYVLGITTAASAQYTDPPTGSAYFMFTNWDNGYRETTPGDPSTWTEGQGPNFTSPTATTEGALWIKNGTAAPVWLEQDVNMRLDWRPTATSPWTTITTLLLQPPAPPPTYTNGSAWGDVTVDGNTGDGYPGYWYGLSGPGNTRGLPDPESNYIYNPVDTLTGQRLGSVSEYWLPNTAGLDFSQFQFELYAWTGTATTFPAAVAAGAHVADSGAFFANPGIDIYSSGGVGIAATGQTTPLSFGAFYNMPAVVLKLSLSGDANYDGTVDINDLTIVLAHYGQTGMGWAQGEFTGDGTVDINDLTIVLAHYGQTAGASAGGISAVPEPSTVLLVAAGLLALLAYGWRKR